MQLPSVSVASPGSGHGLIGMRERVHLCGGSFRAGPLPGGGFQVMAALPLPATAQTARQDPRPTAVPGAAAAPPAASVPAASRAAEQAATANTAHGPAASTAHGTHAVPGAVAGKGGGRG
jgi:hypothetical protein